MSSSSSSEPTQNINRNKTTTKTAAAATSDIQHKLLQTLKSVGAVSESSATDVSTVVSSVVAATNRTPATVRQVLRTMNRKSLVSQKYNPTKNNVNCWMCELGESVLQSRDDTAAETAVEAEADTHTKTSALKGNKRERPVSVDITPPRVKKKMRSMYWAIEDDPHFVDATRAVLFVLYHGEAFNRETGMLLWDVFYRANYLIDFSIFDNRGCSPEDAAIYRNLCTHYVSYMGERGNNEKKKYFLSPEGIAYTEKILAEEPDTNEWIEKLKYFDRRTAEKSAAKQRARAFANRNKRKEEEEESKVEEKEKEKEKEGSVSVSKECDTKQKIDRELIDRQSLEKYSPLGIEELFSLEAKCDDDSNNEYCNDLPDIVDVKLLIDNEVSPDVSAAIIAAFQDNGVTAVRRRDIQECSFIWVGVDRLGREYILNTIIKKLEVSEVSLLTHNESGRIGRNNLAGLKFIMSGAHMQNMTFLVEGDGTMPENADDSAFTGLQRDLDAICEDGLYNLIRTPDADGTLAFLFSVTEQIMAEIKAGRGKRLLFWPGVTPRTLNVFFLYKIGAMKMYSQMLLGSSRPAHMTPIP